MAKVTWKKSSRNNDPKATTVNNIVTRRTDGKYEERLGEVWLAEYSENPDNGLWEVDIFQHDIAKWHGTDYASLEEAQKAAHNFYDQA
jgi:hypothetical protein